jgi:hypothetical protein
MPPSKIQARAALLNKAAPFCKKAADPRDDESLPPGGPPGTRTLDTLIKSQVLYQLS